MNIPSFLPYKKDDVACCPRLFRREKGAAQMGYRRRLVKNDSVSGSGGDQPLCVCVCVTKGRRQKHAKICMRVHPRDEQQF